MPSYSSTVRLVNILANLCTSSSSQELNRYIGGRTRFLRSIWRRLRKSSTISLRLVFSHQCAIPNGVCRHSSLPRRMVGFVGYLICGNSTRSSNELNIYTLPIITDVLKKRKGYEFLTKLDISMQYYTFELDEESKKLCTIVTPFGPFCYKRVAMGLCNSPGFAQARMEEVLRGIFDADVYIDGIAVSSRRTGRVISQSSGKP